jgi:hypothetical protein
MGDVLARPGVSDGKVHYSTPDDEEKVMYHQQRTITQRAGLVPTYQFYIKRAPDRQQSAWEFITNDEDSKAFEGVAIPRCFGFSVEGDGEQEGPLYFASKFFPGWSSCEHILRAFEMLTVRQKKEEVPRGYSSENDKDFEMERASKVEFRRNELDNAADASVKDDIELTEYDTGETETLDTVIDQTRSCVKWDSILSPEENMRGTAAEMDRYLEIDPSTLTAYPEWRDISWGQWIRFAIGNLFGIIVLWGTSGPAIYIMYFSPPVVRCRSSFNNYD